jgi:AhpD family alkylhydroperoxidase
MGDPGVDTRCGHLPSPRSHSGLAACHSDGRGQRTAGRWNLRRRGPAQPTATEEDDDGAGTDQEPGSYLVNPRASQINGCSVCVDIHSRELEHAGESSERILMVAAWRGAPYFSDAERAALALTEAATRLADNPDPVSDEVWDEAARHYSESQLAALVVAIAATNAFNRLNATTRQITGAWVDQIARAAAKAA